MGAGDVVYCIVDGSDCALYGAVERCYARDRGVRVIAERRDSDRREAERRGHGIPVELGERRRIHAIDGRRTFERRAELRPTMLTRLPRRLRSQADAVRFVLREEPDPALVEDADTNRLVAAFQGGDVQAFSAIYDRYAGRVQRAVNMGLRDFHAAEDLTQDVFVCAMDKLRTYEIRPDQPVRAWLLGIARFEALNYARKHRRVVVGLDTYDDAAVEAPSDFERRVFGVLTDPEIGAVIEQMPERQREVIALRYVFDYKLVEIARLLDRSPESIRQLHVRALAHLEERLSAMGRGPEAARDSRFAMRRGLRQAIVLRTRRFVLTRSAGVPGLSWRTAAPRRV
jgi:RNA polymerase sigma-70 factor (ECF subfamily)